MCANSYVCYSNLELAALVSMQPRHGLTRAGGWHVADLWRCGNRFRQAVSCEVCVGSNKRQFFKINAEYPPNGGCWTFGAGVGCWRDPGLGQRERGKGWNA